MPSLKRSWLIALFAIPPIIFALIATKGTMNFLYPEYGWVFYNQYAIAISQGRLWIPAEAIGPEGFYVGGHVYGYYGILPALLRLPFIPFVDLRTTPLSVILNWTLAVSGVLALQLAALDVLRWRLAQGGASKARWVFGLAAISLAFFSGSMLVIQKSSFYFEPFAASLLLAALFILVSVRVLLFGSCNPSRMQLALLATFAALCLFGRQTTAISLYAGVMLWMAVSLYNFWQAGERRYGRLLLRAISIAAAPMTILLIGGLLYVNLNIIRFGQVGASYPIDSYGYLLMDPHDARLLNIRNEGQFHWTRILPNLVFALIGGDELRHRFIAALGGGTTGALGHVIRLALAWTPSLLLSGLSFAWLAARARTERMAVVALLLLGCFAIGATIQLAYATAQYRYHVDLWPPFALLVVLSAAAAPGDSLKSGSRKLLAMVGGGAMLLSAAYVASWAGRVPGGGNTLNEPLPQVLIDHATAPGSRDPYLPGGTPLPRAGSAPAAKLADQP